jgi:DNA modification methylase
MEGELFRNPTMSATTMHAEMKLTCDERARAVAEEVNASDEQWLVWCNTNGEADALKDAIPGAYEIRGSDSAKKKEDAVMDFANGKIRVLLSKPSIFGFGVNWQNCRNVAFVGLSYSYEQLYQALRRSWRFGQTREVNAIIVQASTEGKILAAIQEKMRQHEEMKKEMRFASDEFRLHNHKPKINTSITMMTGKNWKVYNGDCVRVAQTLEPNSIGFTIFSPPFPDVFVYSDDEQDMGNCSDLEQFVEQFRYLVIELMRVTMPGREVAVHCVDLLSTKWKDGAIGFKDFSGIIARAFMSEGWLFHSRITIWKSPVTEMQRTKAHGLLYKTLRADSSKSRVGAPDYLLVFRKPGENLKPITHEEKDFPLEKWQEIASPVWMTVDQGRVLNGKEAKDQSDERHICPLQLDVVERALLMWSNPDDLVFSPFTGIGSEGYCALNMKRRFVGSELKPSYFEQAGKFLAEAEDYQEQNLFANSAA